MGLESTSATVQSGPSLLAGGAVILFICSRLLSSWWGRRGLAWRAGGNFVPIAAVAVGAMVMGWGDVAVGVLFGTSVAAMTSVLGFVAMAGPVGDGPAALRRIWAFPLVAALLVFIAGFKGIFDWRDAVALLVQGFVLKMLWSNPSEVAGGADVPHDPSIPSPLHAPPGIDPSKVVPPARTAVDAPVHPVFLSLQFILLAAALALGAWGITRGLNRILAELPPLRFFSRSGLAASAISMALVLPMMYGTWRAASRGRSWEPVTTQVVLLLLNLCLLLPALVLIPYLAAYVPPLARWTGTSLAWEAGRPNLLLYPAPFWRIDNVILLLVGALLLPVSLGRWRIGKEEGLVLVAAYFFYLTAILASTGMLGR